MATKSPEATAVDLLRAYLDALALSEDLQTRAWEAAQLTLTQVRALRKLGREPMALGQLGASMQLTPPSVTRLIDRLERRGLIERIRDSDDRRRVVARLTDDGRRVTGELPFDTGAIRAAAEDLSPADRARLVGAFNEFAAAVRRFEEEPMPAGRTP
jgi:DNA-binding MarR family transcriptional regulator